MSVDRKIFDVVSNHVFSMERENSGNREMRCTYHRDRKNERWVSDCGLSLSSLGKQFIYCPRCGKEIKRAI